MSIEPLLAQAYGLLQQRQLAEAESLCREALGRAPNAAAAIHLLGLIRKDAGELAEGERLLRRSIELAPGRAEFHANLGNLLHRLGRLQEAESSYRKALACDSHHAPARIGLALTFRDAGRLAAAEGECRTLLATRSTDAQGWLTLGMILRDQHRLAEAEAAYRRAVELAPGYPVTHHNLGALLSQAERPEEALASLERASMLGLRGFELEFNRGRALLQLCRLDEAEDAFARAVEMQPLNAEAQANLARLRFARGDEKFARAIVDAARKFRDDDPIQLLLAEVLRRADDLGGAEVLLRDLIGRKGASADRLSALAAVLHDAGRLDEAEKLAIAAAAQRPQDPGIIETLVAVLLAKGRGDEALPFIQTERQRSPGDQRWLTYEATASRQIDRDRYAELYDFDRLVRVYDLEPPAGWSSVMELNGAVEAALQRRHCFAMHPLDQSLRHGSQTARSLLTDPDPAIQALLRAFRGPIEDYRRAIGSDPAHPLTARNVGEVAISGCWSVQLRQKGFHVNHIHPRGWVSSAYYVSVPPEVEDADIRSGWIKFGEARFPVPDGGPERFVQPRAGRLVLFPSYMWHGTNPIHGTQPRLTIAFDSVPVSGR